MIAAILLAASLAAGPAVSAAEAERLARSGHHREALAAFQALAARDADDFESRVWTGRLLGWLGRPSEAAEVFRDVVVRAPGRIDARVGLGGALVNQGRLDEAMAVIAEAEVLAPLSSDVLALKGRALRLAGELRAARAAYDAAYRLTPGDEDVRAGRSQTIREMSHRGHVAVAVEDTGDGLPVGRIVDADADLRLDDRRRVFGRMQVHDRFGERAVRAGGGAEWRAARTVLARGAVMAAPASGIVARADALGEIELLRPRWQPAVGVRYLAFDGVRVWVFAPSVTVDLSDTAALVGRYYRSEARFEAAGRTAGNDSGLVMLRWRIDPRVWLTGAYARGYESFDRLTTDRLGRFRADTVAGGVRLDLAGMTSVALGTEYQWRSGGRRMLRLTADVVKHFDWQRR